MLNWSTDLDLDVDVQSSIVNIPIGKTKDNRTAYVDVDLHRRYNINVIGFDDSHKFIESAYEVTKQRYAGKDVIVSSVFYDKDIFAFTKGLEDIGRVNMSIYSRIKDGCMRDIDHYNEVSQNPIPYHLFFISGFKRMLNEVPDYIKYQLLQIIADIISYCCITGVHIVIDYGYPDFDYQNIEFYTNILRLDKSSKAMVFDLSGLIEYAMVEFPTKPHPNIA